jgi:hypothetical protein
MYEVTFSENGIIRKAYFSSNDMVSLFNTLTFRYATNNIQIISVIQK